MEDDEMEGVDAVMFVSKFMIFPQFVC